MHHRRLAQRLPRAGQRRRSRCDQAKHISRQRWGSGGNVAQRARFMEAAARIKPSRDVVHDEWRIADVLEKVSAEAASTGAPVAIIEPVWRELVRQSIAYEFTVWDRTRAE